MRSIHRPHSPSRRFVSIAATAFPLSDAADVRRRSRPIRALRTRATADDATERGRRGANFRRQRGSNDVDSGKPATGVATVPTSDDGASPVELEDGASLGERNSRASRAQARHEPRRQEPRRRWRPGRHDRDAGPASTPACPEAGGRRCRSRSTAGSRRGRRRGGRSCHRCWVPRRRKGRGGRRLPGSARYRRARHRRRRRQPVPTRAARRQRACRLRAVNRDA